jgi:hypothetical protein
MGNDLLVNILGIASGNQNRGGGRRRPEMHDRSHSKSWSKSRGHKSHGRKHGKKDC